MLEKPSNIALIKYWGKLPNQIPMNSSISLTLNKCHTISSIKFDIKQRKNDNIDFKFTFHNKKMKSFEEKIKSFLTKILPYAPYIKNYTMSINSQNSFPHSSGIASSASAFASLSLCIMSMEKQIYGLDDDFFIKKASFLSRLGSGSACRSINGSICVWGQSKFIKGSSNIYAIKYPYEINPIYDSIHNAILVVDSNSKKISSSQGHDLVNKNKFVKVKNAISNQNMSKIKDLLKNGDLFQLGNMVEQESLTLHAMMMTSNPYFILMKPNTLNILEKIILFRQDSKNNIFFTMDAGANVHLLYPKSQKNQVKSFISSQLLQYCKDKYVIYDYSGNGSKEIIDK